MISEVKERTLLSLLAQGQLSERQIARAAEVARGTVRSRKAGYRGHIIAAPPIETGLHCPICHVKLTEFPCRACALRREFGLDPKN